MWRHIREAFKVIRDYNSLNRTDDLIKESRRLRDQLQATSERLDVYTKRLNTELALKERQSNE